MSYPRTWSLAYRREEAMTPAVQVNCWNESICRYFLSVYLSSFVTTMDLLPLDIPSFVSPSTQSTAGGPPQLRSPGTG